MYDYTVFRCPFLISRWSAPCYRKMSALSFFATGPFDSSSCFTFTCMCPTFLHVNICSTSHLRSNYILYPSKHCNKEAISLIFHIWSEAVVTCRRQLYTYCYSDFWTCTHAPWIEHLDVPLIFTTCKGCKGWASTEILLVYILHCISIMQSTGVPATFYWPTLWAVNMWQDLRRGKLLHKIKFQHRLLYISTLQMPVTWARKVTFCFLKAKLALSKILSQN